MKMASIKKLLIRLLYSRNKTKVEKEQDKYRRQFLRFHRNSKNQEISNMVKHIRQTEKFSMINTPLTKDYDNLEMDVFYDDIYDLKYVYIDGKKLYVKRGLADCDIKSLIRSLLKEQDDNSCHRYLNEDDLSYIKQYKENGGYIRLFELGSMEGMFSLKLADYVDEIHIFECENEWIDALRATFAQFSINVKIVNKYVGNLNDEKFISLDFYYKNQSLDGLNIVKMDIEGAEIDALLGMNQFMKRSENFKLFVCTYHKANDELQVREICKDYKIETTPGYFCFYVSSDYKAPYIRRCILKISK